MFRDVLGLHVPAFARQLPVARGAGEEPSGHAGDCFYMAMRGEGMRPMNMNPCASESPRPELSHTQGFKPKSLPIALIGSSTIRHGWHDLEGHLKQDDEMASSKD